MAKPSYPPRTPLPPMSPSSVSMHIYVIGGWNGFRSFQPLAMMNIKVIWSDVFQDEQGDAFP